MRGRLEWYTKGGTEDEMVRGIVTWVWEFSGNSYVLELETWCNGRLCLYVWGLYSHLGCLSFLRSFDVIWWLLILFDDFWCHLMPLDVFWCLLMLFDTFWCLLMSFLSFDGIWCLSTYFAAFWCILMPSDVFGWGFWVFWETSSKIFGTSRTQVALCK